MGMRGHQLVRRLEIPVALPVILGGFRSAAFQVVATLTLGAMFGGPASDATSSRASPRRTTA